MQIRSAKNAFWLKCLKDLKEVCLSPAVLWFRQFDKSGAADRVMVTNTSVGDISSNDGTRVVGINVIEVGNDVKVGIVRVSEVMS